MTTGADIARYGSVTAEQVRALDAAALASGVTTAQLMEIAGWQVARCAWQMVGRLPADIGVVAGHGNNGGDGLVAARHLATWGCQVRVVVIARPGQLGEIATRHIDAAKHNGVEVIVAADPDRWKATLSASALVIDAILGTGLTSTPRESQASAISALNHAQTRVLAVDVPSGLDATTGQAFSPPVTATATCTLAAVKAGLWTGEGRAAAGDLWIADIGMPGSAWVACGLARPSAVAGGELVPISPSSRR